MGSTRGLFLLPVSFVVTSAFTNFNVEPTCVPGPDHTTTEEILPFFCKFEEDAESWAAEDCLDLPAECSSIDQKLTWAFTKMYAKGQDSDRPGCQGMGDMMLSRDVKHPECVFGEPVPEARVGDLFESMYEARDAAEEIFSANPTYCAAQVASKMYDIYAQIYEMRLSKVAMHGLRFNARLELEKLEKQWNPETNDCSDEKLKIFGSLTPPEIKARLAAQKWRYSRKVFSAEDCTVVGTFNGGSFAKPHDGGFEGCQMECLDAPKCNAFNMDLKFHVTMKQHSCVLLNCPADASMSTKYGHASFKLKPSKRSRTGRKTRKEVNDGKFLKFGGL